MKASINSILWIFIFFSSSLAFVHAQTLTVEAIFGGEFKSERSKTMKWFEGGDYYTTLVPNKSNKQVYDLVKTNTQTSESEILLDGTSLITADNKPLMIENYQWSENKSKLLLFTNSKRVWRRNTKGDYYVYDIKSKNLTKLGGPAAKPSTLMFAKFSPDGNQVGYVREHNIYVESLNKNKVTTLTTDGTTKIINGTFDWAYEEEFGCRDGFRWSPDGKHIAYWQIDATTIRDFLMINNTDSVYSYTIPVQYPKAGEKPSSAKIGVVNTRGGATTWMDLPGPADNQYIPRMIWNPDGKSLLVQHMNRAQNHNKVTSCTIKTGQTNVIYEDKETAWLEAVDDFTFLQDNTSFTWVSEKSGWKACYSIKDGEETQLTEGMDMVEVVLLDESNGWLYFMGSKDNATQMYLYRTSLKGDKEAQRITPSNQEGFHAYSISPNGKYAKHSYSSSMSPPVTEIIKVSDHTVVETLVSNESLKKKIESAALQPKDFFTVQTNDGMELDGYMIKPSNFDKSKKYPVLFHVYGEPWGQTVLDSWGGGNGLFHQMIAQKGYIIMSIDNRGTPAPKGRDWRKCVYGQIGVLSSSDQAEAVQAIINTYDFVDSDRIGIWGWSGGGSMTLNALFRYPEIYKTGISIAPVANQLLYDNIYQERYSGVPQDMPESYKKGSPITYAHQLEGNLLLIHGTGDDNVHYQNAEVLINKLIQHNKMFSMMAYPNRSHGIWEGDNTSIHLRHTMMNYILENL